MQGGRSCVGVRLAYAEAKIALIKLYQHYTLRLVPGQVLHTAAVRYWSDIGHGALRQLYEDILSLCMSAHHHLTAHGMVCHP